MLYSGCGVNSHRMLYCFLYACVLCIACNTATEVVVDINKWELLRLFTSVAFVMSVQQARAHIAALLCQCTNLITSKCLILFLVLFIY